MAASSERPCGAARPWLWPVLLGTTLLWASGAQVAPAAPFRGWINVHAWAHFFVFGLMATLVLRCFGAHWYRPRALIGAFLITALVGIGDEFRQSFNPVRVFSTTDALIDCVGAAVAITAYRLWPAYRRLLESGIRPASGQSSDTVEPVLARPEHQMRA